jgi:hypothetical protein
MTFRRKRHRGGQIGSDSSGPSQSIPISSRLIPLLVPLWPCLAPGCVTWCSIVAVASEHGVYASITSKRDVHPVAHSDRPPAEPP